MYLYRCRIIHNHVVYQFYSENKFDYELGDIVKVETRHGIDLAFFMKMESEISKKDLDRKLANDDKNSSKEDEEEIHESELGDDSVDLHKLVEKVDNFEVIKKDIKIEGKVFGKAQKNDIDIYNKNLERAKEGFITFEEQIKKHDLPMKPVLTHFFIDDKKVLFYFIADGRVDFRNLVKALASIFRKRIELHQIGVRDEARQLSGIGVCGQQLCCRRFLNVLNPISIKMAKVQNAPLNTMKISGYCGRLLCCLAYEYEVYEEIKKDLPEEGSYIFISDKKYNLYEINIIKSEIKLKDEQENRFYKLALNPFKYFRKKNGKVIVTKYKFLEE